MNHVVTFGVNQAFPAVQQPEDFDDEPEMEVSDAQREAERTMTDDERNRFALLLSNNCTQIPNKKIKEIMEAVAPEGCKISEETSRFAAHATKLFVAELVETAKQFHTGKNPLTPEEIMLSFRKLEEEGKIPGKSSGTRRDYIK